MVEESDLFESLIIDLLEFSRDEGLEVWSSFDSHKNEIWNLLYKLRLELKWLKLLFLIESKDFAPSTWLLLLL